MLLSLAPPLAAALALAAPSLRLAGYAPPRSFVLADTLRSKTADVAPSRGVDAAGTAIPGYLSSWGLPPVQGQMILTDTGLVFQDANGTTATRASTISLAYVDDENGRAHYLFRMEAGVFETEAPHALLEAAAKPGRSAAGSTVRQRSFPNADSAGSLRAARQMANSRYADSLYALFGRPRAGVGLIGPRGRAAGRLGEYIRGRDSLAFDPVRMTGQAQLRHALAHELGHRWQARATAQLATLWTEVRGIRDPKRYGYGSVSEHQAEAIAFAISFLQTTATAADASASALVLLDHYDLLVPGTRTMVRYFALQSPYRNHPLRARLTTGRITYALEK